MTVAVMQGIAMKTTGVHHVALRSTDLARAKVFYIERLGFPGRTIKKPGRRNWKKCATSGFKWSAPCQPMSEFIF